MHSAHYLLLFSTFSPLYHRFDVNGTRTTVKMMDTIRYNFFIANYQTLGAVDNDDGSSYYDTYSNFFIYSGGAKTDFEGHDSECSTCLD